MWNTAGKIDIKHAFQLLPVHLLDCHLLAMDWKTGHMAPLQSGVSPWAFNILADLLAWILEQQGVTPFLHYLDDFLLMGPPQSPRCQDNQSTVKLVCSLFGIYISSTGESGRTIRLTFLGITLDTPYMEVCLPAEKLQCIRTSILSWLQKKKATKWEIHIITCGVASACHKSSEAWSYICSTHVSHCSQGKKLSYYTRLTKGIHLDLQWWHTLYVHY